MQASHSPPKEQRLQGTPVSPGIALGSVRLLYRAFAVPFPRRIAPENVAQEVARLERAVAATRQQIEALQQRIANQAGTEHAEIFDAHLLVLEDRTILDEVLRRLRSEHLNVEHIYYEVMRRYIESLRRIDDPYLRERVIDIEDVTHRMIRNLRGDGQAGVKRGGRHILVGYDLTPSDTAVLEPGDVLGFATEVGSPTSHTAIMARSMNIPAVVGLTGLRRQLQPGQEVLIDGIEGLVILDPSEETRRDYEEKQRERAELDHKLAALRDRPAETKDGRRYTLSANIEFNHELDLAKESGAAGVGLYRTEFGFLNDPHAGEDVMAQIYTEAVQQLAPEAVIFRTLDVGGDKILPDTQGADDPNPFLGWRGIRVSLQEPVAFRRQLRAILRAAAHGRVGIMFPMVSDIHEVREARRMVEACAEELEAEGVPIGRDLELGVMIEVPSAALCADVLAAEVDFFSIGTNDLVQYTLAVDRLNERVSHLYRSTHPSVLQLIRRVVEAGHRHGIWVGVCGEMAGDLDLVPLMVGLGLDELSVAAGQLPRVKHAMRSLDYGQCSELVENALRCGDVDQIARMTQEAARAAYPELY